MAGCAVHSTVHCDLLSLEPGESSQERFESGRCSGPSSGAEQTSVPVQWTGSVHLHRTGANVPGQLH